MTSTAGRGGGARPLVIGCAAVVLAALAGCGSQSEGTVRDTASQFVDAVGAADFDAACELLLSDTVELLESLRPEGCAEVLPELELGDEPVSDVEVWGDAAMARAGGDVLFLRDGPDGWRVAAAGCQPSEPDRPYDCALEGS